MKAFVRRRLGFFLLPWNQLTAKIPVAYALSQNYPNPFNPTTSVTFTLSQAAEVRLKVFDINGRTISTLVDGRKHAGYHTITWNASAVPSGVYFMEITTAAFIKTIKVVLAK